MKNPLIHNIETRHQTAWVIGLSCFAMVVWDYFMFANDINGDTISEVTLRNSYRLPLIPFSVGVIMGHLFWPQLIITKN